MLFQLADTYYVPVTVLAQGIQRWVKKKKERKGKKEPVTNRVVPHNEG